MSSEKTITMTEFRAEPGEHVRAVHRHGSSFTITKSGRIVARLVPADDAHTVVERDGTVHGPMPLTYRRPDLLKS